MKAVDNNTTGDEFRSFLAFWLLGCVIEAEAQQQRLAQQNDRWETTRPLRSTMHIYTGMMIARYV
jgi:hypothetical protein